MYIETTGDIIETASIYIEILWNYTVTTYVFTEATQPSQPASQPASQPITQPPSHP